jgi:hypothetical protein
MRGAKIGLLALIFFLVVPVVVTAYSGITTISYRALYLLSLPWVAAGLFRSLLARRAGKAFFVESQFRQILSRVKFVVLAASRRGVLSGSQALRMAYLDLISLQTNWLIFPKMAELMCHQKREVLPTALTLCPAKCLGSLAPIQETLMFQLPLLHVGGNSIRPDGGVRCMGYRYTTGGACPPDYFQRSLELSLHNVAHGWFSCDSGPSGTVLRQRLFQPN